MEIRTIQIINQMNLQSDWRFNKLLRIGFRMHQVKREKRIELYYKDMWHMSPVSNPGNKYKNFDINRILICRYNLKE